ncbi:MAG: DMT family protein [Bacteroidota bacterium]
MQLKVIQEVISMIIFSLFTIFLFKTETFKWNHILSFVFLIHAVFFRF